MKCNTPEKSQEDEVLRVRVRGMRGNRFLDWLASGVIRRGMGSQAAASNLSLQSDEEATHQRQPIT